MNTKFERDGSTLTVRPAGPRVFLAVEQYLGKQGAETKLIHVSERVMEIFELVGFLDVVTVEP